MAPDRLTPSPAQRLFAIAMTVPLATCSSNGHLKHPQENLVAVVDAGSSGSRIYLYKTTLDGLFVKITQLITSKYVPRELSWYDGSRGAGGGPESAGVSGIQPLLPAMAAFMNINGIAKDQVKVSALATAGMRMEDASTTSAIYQSVKITITNKCFPVRQVGTFSG